MASSKPNDVDKSVTLDDVRRIKNGGGEATALDNDQHSESSYTDSLDANSTDDKPKVKSRRKKKSRLPVPKDAPLSGPKTSNPTQRVNSPDSIEGERVEGENPCKDETVENGAYNCCSEATENRDKLSEKRCQRSHSTEEHGSKNSSRSSLSRRETIDLGETKTKCCAGQGLKEGKMDMFMNSNECILIPHPPGQPVHKDTITSRMRIEKAHNEHLESDKSALDYLTPFQRKEHAIKDLKREQRKLNKLLEERQMEIEQLREGLGKEARELLTTKDDKIEEVQKQFDDMEKKYEDLKRSYEESVKTVTNLEATVDDLKENITDINQKHEALYLEMYVKGQNAARYEREEEIEHMAGKANNKLFKKSKEQPDVNIKELLAKLNRTQEELAKWQSLRRQESYQESDKPETEAEATLRFLRDSFYHYMTDSKGQDDHMRAMIQIFNFTEVQKKKLTKCLLDRKSKT
ncbi:hypothetical protein SNE40_021580 [Patella caerulea]|uniref:GRIP domain-containing protein n=1 Tax=Patella caerulea TaxID=87958 RepID=A0AAN8GCS4_PATCE